jgi:hypothetical protein
VREREGISWVRWLVVAVTEGERERGSAGLDVVGNGDSSCVLELQEGEFLT